MNGELRDMKNYLIIIKMRGCPESLHKHRDEKGLFL